MPGDSCPKGLETSSPERKRKKCLQTGSGKLLDVENYIGNFNGKFGKNWH